MSIRGNAVRYWLEQLPMEGEYDTEVEEFIKKIEYSNEKSDKEMIDIHLDELANYYYWNMELYDEHFSLNDDCYITIEVGPLEKEPLGLTL